MLSLSYVGFDAESVTKKSPANILSSMDEIVYNSIWRFLALRDYVNVNHVLTPWGRILVAAMNGVDQQMHPPQDKEFFEEAVFIAVVRITNYL